MKIAVFAFSRQGCATARRAASSFPESEIRLFTVQRLAQAGFEQIPKPSKPFYGALFSRMDAMIFVGSCGIAVREIASHVKSKQTDPAVIVVDELGKFVIPLLAGHIGGANALALRLAQSLDATAVVTTATDIHQRFSVDAWAARQHFVIDSLPAAKAVSAAILEEDVPLWSDFSVASAYPEGVVPGNVGQIGIYVGYRKISPFTQTLRIIPPVLHLGIGCRRGTEVDGIRFAVEQVLEENALDARAVKYAATIDLKAEEPGLLAFCRENRWPLKCYSPEELRAAEGDFTSSDFVKSVTGVDNVCERAAILGAETLVVRKTAIHGVTVAVAAEKLEVSFG